MDESDQEVEVETSSSKQTSHLEVMRSIRNTANNDVLTLYGDNQTHCGYHFTTHTNVKSLCCTNEINALLYVAYTSIKS